MTLAGHLEEPPSFEAVLNWQTQNVVAQNQAITTLRHKVDHITHKSNQVEKKVDTISDRLNQIYQNLHNRVNQLDVELRAMLTQRIYSPGFDQKEAEIKALKAEIARIDSEKVQPTLFTSSAPLHVLKPTYHPVLPPTSSRTYDPPKLFGMTHTFFPPKPTLKPKKTPNPLLKSIPQQNPQSSRFEPSPSLSPPTLPMTTSLSIPPPVSLEK